MRGKLAKLARSFWLAGAANVLVIFGLGAPVLFGVVGITVDYATWLNQKLILQNAADAAALAIVADIQIAAPQLERMQAIAESQVRRFVPLKEGDGPVAVRTAPRYRKTSDDPFAPGPVEGDVRTANGWSVTLTQRKRAIMSRLVTPALTDITVEATAEMAGTIKVCVLVLDAAASGALALRDQSRIDAGNCSVYVMSADRRGLQMTDGAALTSLKSCVVGGYAGGGYVRPRPISGCPPMRDPLQAREPPPVGGCTYTNLAIADERRTLMPGTYCGGLMINAGASVTLAPGTYVIKDGPLVVGSEKQETRSTGWGWWGLRGWRPFVPLLCYWPELVPGSHALWCPRTTTTNSPPGILTGTNVGFYFTGKVPPDQDGAVRPVQFMPRSTVSLTAGKTGSMAGLLFFEDRDAPPGRQFAVLSDSARRLVGTIYLPRGTFTVRTNQVVADQSEFTAIVARGIDLSSAPRLVINADYGATDVPVPKGIGPTSAMPTLTH
ncbi:TadE/TadG family type IV pilus assembly protein [Methylobacterium sp. WSM2598]|uniref:TadE/TadG family type IV pilus assembly protein n=1 Tax=Methylobacterium sp. WSM2598 TaxID=398261 RepID=UPI0003704069|nr:pilus assembly protein TadG-related protein [Methylobacterium sp. WSM2598]